MYVYTGAVTKAARMHGNGKQDQLHAQRHIRSRVLRRVVQLGLACLPLFAATASIAADDTGFDGAAVDDGPGAHEHVGVAFYRDLDEGNFLAAEALLDCYVKNKSRFLDGEWKSAALLDTYGKIIVTDTDHARDLDALHSWRSAKPASPSAAVAEATYWITYGFWTQGGENEGRLPARALTLGRARVAAGQSVLETTKTFSRSNPAWYSLMIRAATINGEPLERSQELFKEGIAAFPSYFATYDAMAIPLMPRWGGDRDDFDAFVKQAVQRTRSSSGKLMYARLYQLLAQSVPNEDPFTELGIPWPDMRSGFDDLMKHYPKSQWNLQSYAYYACRAGDGKAFLRLLPRIATGQHFASRDIWRGSFTLDFCTRTFSSQT